MITATLNVKLNTRIAYDATKTHVARRAIAVALFKFATWVLGSAVTIETEFTC